MYEKSIAKWTVAKSCWMLLAVTAASLQVSAQQSIAVQVSDSSAHVQYYDQAQINTPHCQAVMAQGGSVPGGGDQVCATSIILAGDTITWTDASGNPVDQHTASQGVCNPTCALDPGGFDVPNSPGFFTGVGQSGANTFNTGPGVFPLWCRAHFALMRGTVIVQDFDLTLSNSTLFAYAGVSTPFNNLGTLTGRPQASETPAGGLTTGVPYNDNVNLSGVTAGITGGCTNGTQPSTCTINPTVIAPGTPTPFTLTVNGAIGNYNFDIQGVGTDVDNLNHKKNVALHTVTMAFTTSPGTVTAPATGTSPADNFSITTNGTFPGTVGLSCGNITPPDPNLACTFSSGNSFNPTSGAHPLSLQVVTTGATGGAHTVTLSADPGGGLAPRTANFTVNVQDYTLSVTPPTNQTVGLGVTATYPVTLTAQNGYSNNVTVTCQGATLPATCTGFTATPTPGGVTNNVIASNPTAGQFNFNIRGVGADTASTTRSQAVQLLVGSIDFPSAPSPNPVSATQGNPSNAATFTVTSSFPTVVTFSCSGAPTGVTCDFSPASVSTSPSPAKTVTVSFRTTTATPGSPSPGTASTITIHAISGGLDSPTSLTLNTLTSANSSDLSFSSLTNNSTAAAAVQEGKSLQFSIGVKNGGPNTAIGSVLLLEFSSAISNPVFGGCTAVTTINPTTFSCSLGSLAVNTFPVTATFPAPVGRSVTVNAKVSSSSTDNVDSNNFASSTAQVRKRPGIRTPPRLP